MINNKFKLIGDIKRYVGESTKKMQSSIKKNSREIRSIRAKVSRIDKLTQGLCKYCNNKIKERK